MIDKRSAKFIEVCGRMYKVDSIEYVHKADTTKNPYKYRTSQKETIWLTEKEHLIIRAFLIRAGLLVVLP